MSLLRLPVISRLVTRSPRLRGFLQRLLYPNRDQTVRVLGAEIAINTQREIGYYRAARLQADSAVLRDEAPELLALASLLRPGTTFVDCGANVGLWSASVARLAPLVPGLKVIAIEPNPETFARLGRTLDGYDNVTLLNVAVSDREGEIEMVEGVVSGVFRVPLGGRYASPKGARRRAVTAWPLDTVLAGRGDLVVKIDVEGHELSVLRGMRKALAAGNVRALYIDGFLPEEEADVVSALKGCGFRLVDGRTMAPYRPGGWSLLAVAE